MKIETNFVKHTVIITLDSGKTLEMTVAEYNNLQYLMKMDVPLAATVTTGKLTPQEDKMTEFVYCPECKNKLEVIFPYSFAMNRARVKCKCGFSAFGLGWSNYDALQNLEDYINKKEST